MEPNVQKINPSSVQGVKLFTIGHSIRPFDEFLSLLREFQIEAILDIRRFPSSRKFPHFNREWLEKALPSAGVEYIWLEDLGGRRSAPNPADSLNAGLTHSAFRHYADYMQTTPFRLAIEKLLSIASEKLSSVMCAEKLFWKCHRRLLSDYFVAQGVTVEHIMDSGRVQSHKLSSGAVLTPDLHVIYPSSGSGSGDPKLFE